LKINIEMAINYSNVRDIINIQYQDRKLKDGSMSLNSLYYDFFKTDMNSILSDNVITGGISRMLGIKTDEDKRQDELDLKELESKYPIVYNKVKYKLYGYT
tara:strand:+ start:3030 stop:3332 length:303 start_codon:yes stop_codon:yes gene_type:complete